MHKFMVMVGLLLFGAWAVPTGATTRYVSQGGGTFNGGTVCNGQTTISVSTFNNTNNSAGDINYLCGTITTPLTPNGNGSSGKVVSILFDTGANITVSACGANSCIDLAGLSYYLVDGGTTCGYVNGVDVGPCNGFIQATGNGTGKGASPSTGIYMYNGASNMEVRNLGIYNMYIHTGIPGDDTVPINQYYCIHLEGSNNSIHNLIEHDCGAGLVGEVTSANIQFYNSQVYNINWGLFGSGSFNPETITNWTVHDNDIHDWANWDVSSTGNHHDGIFFAGNDGTATDVDGVDIYNNYIHGHTSDCPNNCMTAFIYAMDVKNVRSYNNVLVANSGDYMYNGFLFYEVITNSMPGMVIANNTVIGGNTGSGNGSCIYVQSVTNAVVENNVVSNCPVLMWYTSGSTFSSLNYNVYQNPSLSASWQIDGAAGSGNLYNSLAAWRSISGGEANSQATTGSLGLTATTEKQTTASIVIGAGTNLTGLGLSALDTDKLGTARPSSGAWDAGAYELGSSTTVTKPNPPTNLKATAQ